MSERAGASSGARRARRAVAAWWLAALAAALLSFPARALDPSVSLAGHVVRSWTTEEGLPQNSVNAILQTRDGYLWLATFGGLARFDGVAFRVFDADSDAGLASSRILSLLEDSRGRLWVGTEDRGVFVYDGERFADPLSTPWPGGAVWALAQARDGAIWLATDRGARRAAGGRLEGFGRAEGLPDPWVRDLAVSPDGVLWAATHGGSARFDGARFVAASPAPAWALGFRPGGGLAGGEDELVELATGRVLLRRGDGARGPLVRELLHDRNGTLWIAGERLGRWAPGSLLPDVDERGRFGSSIKALFEDREGSLWAGSEGGGLRQLRTGAAVAFTRADGLASDSALPIVEDRDGRIWIGGMCGGLTSYTRGEWREVPVPADTRTPCVSTLAVGRDGALWVGYQNLLRYADGDWSEVVRPRAFGTLRALVEDARGRLWLGSDAGVARLDGERLVPVAGLAGEPVWALRERRDGTLAAGLVSAVARLETDATAAGGVRVTRVALDAGRAPAPVRDLWEAADGALWAATYGAGLARIAPDGRVAHVGTAQGLAEPFVSRLLPDGRGGLWLSGNRGLYCLDVAELERAAAGGRVAPRTLGVADGLAVAEMNGGGSPAGWRARDGRLWFPSVRGVAVVDPARLKSNPHPPPVAIEEIVVDGRVHPAAGAAVAPLAVSAAADRVEIRYTGLGLARPERLTFRYRLVGVDSGWQSAGSRRFAVYTHLPAGAHRFEVVATNEDGVTSPAPAALELAVTPRWFETLPVRIAAAVAALAALVALDRLRSMRLKRRKAELEHVVAVRTAELASLNENLERIVADQTDQIRETRDMAILTLAKLAELRDGTTGEHLDRIARFSRRLVEAIARGPYGPLGDDFVEEIYRSSPLHDIGKVAIPDAILQKAGPLSAEEREVMKTHTTIGGDTLKRVVERGSAHSFLGMGMTIAYGHHERWDGRGYPRGARADATPLPARIVALVDAYDAITSARPYKPPLAHEVAVERIVVDRGTHFDPLLVDAFLGIHRELDRIRREHPSSAS